MPTRIEFGSLDAANNIREDSQFRGFLADSDKRSSKTVVLKDGTPEPALNEIAGAAADSKSHEADKAGQVSLTQRERNEIDFTRPDMDVPTARSIKAIAQQEGVSDWTHRADFTLSVDENRRILQQREGGGARGGRDRQSDAEVSKRLASAHNERQANELDRAKDFALLETDSEAQGFLREQGSVGDVFDVGFDRTDDGRLQGHGEDFDRLEERHESRSSRAQTMDEKRSAKTTRDPVQWANNPGKYDYPGIDTVQPEELHDDRSPQAQAVDERSAAPFADSREQWAMNPDEYDWPGVDDADPERLHESRSEAAQTRDENELAPIADSKQQWARSPGQYDWPGVDTPNEPVLDTSPDTSSSGGEFFREIDGDRIPASVALEDDPVPDRGGQRVDAPGLAPGDLEGEFDESIGMSETNTPVRSCWR